jgi:hypothetical protein
MRKALWAAFAVLALAAGPAAAAPCTSAALSDYLTGGSCDVAGITVDDFRLFSLPAGTAPIDPASVTVAPIVGPAGLSFTLGRSAGAGDLLGLGFGFSVGGSGLIGAVLELLGAAASGDGAVTAIQGLCFGGIYVDDPVLGATCAATELTQIAFAIDPIADALQTLAFAPASLVDVFVELAVDGGLAGSAALGAVRLAFPVPEPGGLGLAALGLVALAAWTRRRKPPA